MSSYLLDTSVFVAVEHGGLVDLPATDDGRLSAATLTELLVGQARAEDPDLRRLREFTVARARRFAALPFDDRVAERLAVLLSQAGRVRRHAGAFDAIIAATALVHDLTVLTMDADFEAFREFAPGLRVVRP